MPGVLSLLHVDAKFASRSKYKSQTCSSQNAKPEHRYSGRDVGSINITDTSCFVPRDELTRVLPNTYEIQRPKICERLGSAARLKADSHPIGGRDSVVTTGDERATVWLGASGKRSPL